MFFKTNIRIAVARLSLVERTPRIMVDMRDMDTRNYRGLSLSHSRSEQRQELLHEVMLRRIGH